MVELKEVEALLAMAQSVAPADAVFGEERIGVEGSTLAALCRAWLAVQEAPTVEVTQCNQIAGASDFDHGDMAAAVEGLTPGQRVRIVKEVG